MTGQGTPRYSIITTCKGRLAHLTQSLPRFLAQPGTEVIVVDYDCPDGTRDFVAREYPAARVVAVDGAPQFNVADARNRGAAAAAGTWLIFMDADVLVAPATVERLDRAIDGKAATDTPWYFRFAAGSAERYGLFGSCAVRRADYDAIGGYDAVFAGYGGEDTEFYVRLARAGIDCVELAEDTVERVLQHDATTRMRHFARDSLFDSLRINSAYRLAKIVLLRQMEVVELPLELRRELYAMVEKKVLAAIASGAKTLKLAIPLPEEREIGPVRVWQAKRYILLDLTMRSLGTESG